MRPLHALSSSIISGAVIIGLAMATSPARADDQPAAPAAAPAAPAAPAAWIDGIKFSGYLEGGFTGNFDSPSDHLNIGHAFTDRSNEFLFNQGSFIVERPIDPSQAAWDFGFRFQGMVGSDARYTRFLNEGSVGDSRVQFDIVEAHLDEHMPILTSGGIDVKAGAFTTLMGAEVIDPRGNPLYTHSYIFNYGLPLKDFGVMVVTHASPLIDVYTGLITGINTSFGSGDNNSALAFEGGIGLNISDSLTILATANIGPENPCRPNFVAVDCNGANRYIADLVATYKINDKLTSITELNFIADDGPADYVGSSQVHPKAGGVAQYLTYALNDMFTLVGRGEIFRDANGFFVGAFPGNSDFVNVEKGSPNTAFLPSPSPTTYGELTVGVTIKPPVPKLFEGLMVRPELRVDSALGGNQKPFNDGTSSTQVTASVDVVIPF